MEYKNRPMDRPQRLVKRPMALVLGLTLMLAVASAFGQVQSTWLNTTTLTTPPNISATNVVNKGVMEFGTAPYPFRTTYTLNYTNFGEMIGSVGWQFDRWTGSGPHTMSASFFNTAYNPSVSPVAGYILSEYTTIPNPLTSAFGFPLDYLWVSATNIVNKGVLLADAAGEIKLVGTNVNLSRGFVEISPISGVGSAVTTTNFTPDTAIYDKFWGVGLYNPFGVTGFWDGTTATSPQFAYNTPCQGTGNGVMQFVPLASDSYSVEFNFFNGFYTNYITMTNVVVGTNSPPTPTTNIVVVPVVFPLVVPSNIIHQAVFVNATDPYISASTGFSPPPVSTGNDLNHDMYQTVGVELFDALTGNTFELQDTIASALTPPAVLPNTVLYPSAACSDVTGRPANYTVARTGLGIGAPGFGPPPANFLWDPSWNNPSTNGTFADYSSFVDNQIFEPPTQPIDFLHPASSVTNLLGRIHITAGNLNLQNTQMRGEGEVMIQAAHVVSSQNAVIDCENLSYNLGSTNGVLNVQNFVPSVVNRFNGTNTVWSAVWSNLLITVTPSFIFSNIVDTNQTPPMTNLIPFQVFLTNFTIIGLSDTMLDAGGFTSFRPVTVYDLSLHSTNMVINDSMSVIDTFLLDGPSFTLNASLTFPGVALTDPISVTPFSGNPIQNWVYTMAPTLRYFTNNGVLTVAQDAHFGDDGPTNYLAFINNGLIVANSQTINCANLQINNGVNESLVSDFIATANTAVLSNAQIAAAGDIDINAGSLTVDPSQLSANLAINLIVSGSLSDGGIGAGNNFLCQNGFNLPVKPAIGDFWGTTFTTMTYWDEEVDHTWAGVDRGAFAAGFTNNAAMFSLVLSPQSFSAPYYPLFYFSGTTGNNGMYVGTLDLSQLGSINQITNMIGIDPSLTVYYAHMLLGFTPPGLQTPEQYMDGQFGGHLRWVKNFNAFTAAAVSQAPKPKLVASYLKPKGQVSLTLTGVPGYSYIVQASTNLVNWVPVCTNNTSVNGQFQYLDSNAAGYRSRFYRAVPVGP